MITLIFIENEPIEIVSKLLRDEVVLTKEAEPKTEAPPELPLRGRVQAVVLNALRAKSPMKSCEFYSIVGQANFHYALNGLIKKGLVEHIERGVYAITDKGIAS